MDDCCCTLVFVKNALQSLFPPGVVAPVLASPLLGVLLLMWVEKATPAARVFALGAEECWQGVWCRRSVAA